MKFILVFLLAFAGFFSAGAQSWPFGKADYQTATIASDSTVSLDIANRLTYVTVPSITVNITVHLDVDKLQKGSFLYVELPNGAVAKTVTWGDKINGPVLTGTVNKTKICSFLWDGTVFRKVGEVLYD